MTRMKINVLFFGATADAAGVRQTAVDVEPGAASGRAFDAVLERYPAIRNHKLLYSVNQEYSDRSELLTEGDELAIFTAVSGG